MKIYPIVEGHGEVEALPVLLRRLLNEAHCHNIGIGRPIRRNQSQLRSKEGIQAGVKLARLQPECSAVVILFDGEDDCPKELAAIVRQWANEVAQGIPCDVVVAYREYETWFWLPLNHYVDDTVLDLMPPHLNARNPKEMPRVLLRSICHQREHILKPVISRE